MCKTKRIGRYESPLGPILLAGDEDALVGLWFEGQKFERSGLSERYTEGELPVFTWTRHWLDRYFDGQEPERMPNLHPQGTAFQTAVWSLLRDIPYGTTSTYGELARRLARQMGRSSLSAQAVGGAVARNPISILIPCHRVIGADGSLTGYAGGVERKKALLQLEAGHADCIL